MNWSQNYLTINLLRNFILCFWGCCIISCVANNHFSQNYNRALIPNIIDQSYTEKRHIELEILQSDSVITLTGMVVKINKTKYEIVLDTRSRRLDIQLNQIQSVKLLPEKTSPEKFRRQGIILMTGCALFGAFLFLKMSGRL